MTHIEIIITGLALAFCWVNILQVPSWNPIFNIRPFNCTTCMSGWMSFTLAAANQYQFYSVFFLAIGVFVGALLERLIMRYL